MSEPTYEAELQEQILKTQEAYKKLYEALDKLEETRVDLSKVLPNATAFLKELTARLS